MDNENISSAPQPVQVPPPLPVDPAGNSTNSSDQIGASIRRASTEAVREHVAANPPKRGRGRPPKSSAQIPLGPMDAGTAPPLAPLPPQAEDAPPAGDPFDEEAACAICDGIIEAMNDVASAIQRTHAMHVIGKKAIADEAAQSARMSETAQKNIRFGMLACAKKYAVDLQYAPEAAVGIPLALWVIGNYIAYKRIADSGPQVSDGPVPVNVVSVNPGA